MNHWEIENRASYGCSSAAKWEGATADVAEMLEKALDECIAVHGSTLYLEMWPSSGRFICYPANPPKEGKLAERASEFLVQLEFPFWETAWLGISLNATNSELRYEQLKREALDALVEAFKECGSRRSDAGRLALYAFEFEGSEGVTVITKDDVYELW